MDPMSHFLYRTEPKRKSSSRRKNKNPPGAKPREKEEKGKNHTLCRVYVWLCVYACLMMATEKASARPTRGDEEKLNGEEVWL